MADESDETIPLKVDSWVQAWRDLPYEERPPLLQFIQAFLDQGEVDALQAQQFEALKIGTENPVQQRVFDALRDKLTLATAELALLRPNERRVHDYEDTHEVLLIPRPDTDPFYAGKLGIRGTFLIGKERPMAAAQRVVTNGLGLHPTQVVQLSQIGCRYAQTPRNNEVGMLHVGYLNVAFAKDWKQPAGSRWVLPSQLPADEMMPHHVALVRDVHMHVWRRARPA
jgi:hypothetical protein